MFAARLLENSPLNPTQRGNNFDARFLGGEDYGSYVFIGLTIRNNKLY